MLTWAVCWLIKGTDMEGPIGSLLLMAMVFDAFIAIIVGVALVKDTT